MSLGSGFKSRKGGRNPSKKKRKRSELAC